MQKISFFKLYDHQGGDLASPKVRCGLMINSISSGGSQEEHAYRKQCEIGSYLYWNRIDFACVLVGVLERANVLALSRPLPWAKSLFKDESFVEFGQKLWLI